MRRGYFDDFTDLKETGGRTFPVSKGLVPDESAPAFPVFTVRLHLSAALEESPRESAALSLDTDALSLPGDYISRAHISFNFGLLA